MQPIQIIFLNSQKKFRNFWNKKLTKKLKQPIDLKTAIVILNWNGEKMLKCFLPSVIKNTPKKDTEIIIADNGSTDSSITFIKNNFSEVKIIELKKNYGFAEGYNKALEKIDSNYYILLNSDVEVTPGWLNPLIELMDKDPKVAAVQPKILNWKKKDEFEYAGAAGGFIDKLGFPLCRGRVLDIMEKDNGQYNNVSSIFWASGACMAIKAKFFREAGGFDSDFWAHMEEIDLCWRLKNKGLKILYTPDSSVYHLGGGTLPYNNPFKLFLNFRNSLWLLHKNLPSKKFVRILITRLLLDDAGAIRWLITGDFKDFLSVIKSHIAYYHSLPILNKKRKKLKSITPQKWHPEIICRSIIFKYYFERKKYFNDIL